MPTPFFSRRQLLRGSAAAAGLSLLPGAARACVRPATATASATGDLPDGAVVLFQGDSITDAGRDRGRKSANDAAALGRGYPLLLAASLQADHPGKGLKVHNRGISGNKVPDLEKRWQDDCLALKPAVVSILIGVNDIWHKLNGNYNGTVDDYREGFAALLTQTAEALPEARLVVCQPFVLRCGAVNDSWFPEFTKRREAAAEVARDADATWVPFQDAFDKAVEAGSDPAHWAGDGVHATLAGHELMARTWREATGL